MTHEGISRREWLSALGLSPLWPQIVAAQEHAHRAASATGPSALGFFDAPTAGEIEALAAQIIPSDGTPGAREAGVIYFIDRALTTFAKDTQEAYRKGIEEAQKKRAEMFPESKSIAALTSQQQVALLEAIEKTPFFQVIWFHTVLGFFGGPSRGGNRNLAGWKLIGFEDRPVFEPPFGYYDAQPRQGEKP